MTALTPAIPADLPTRIAAVVGDRHVVADAGAMAPYLHEERGHYTSRAPFAVRPGSTAELAEVVRLCAAARVPVVPLGGNTGLCGGAVAAGEVLIATDRLTAIRGVDPVNFTMTVEAGAILAQVQAAADDAGCLFPLSLAAEGSCRIGGNLATNAGGINVLRYGNARDLVLGLEVVLADGRIWNGLRALGKDNTGYNLKHMFLGAEGTLGIITAAVLKLFPKPAERATALLAVPTVADAGRLLALARAASGDQISAFELIPRLGLEMTARHIDGCRDPLEGPSPWYVLAEFATSRRDAGLRTAFEALLEQAFADGLVTDGVVAESDAQARALWRIRESIPEAQKHEGGSIKHDVAVPVSRCPEFVERAVAAVCATVPGIRPVPFGHLGDGNIHLNFSQPEGADRAAFMARADEVHTVVFDLVAELDGSISAEHGVGILKRDDIVHYKSEVEIDLMARVKRALDPDNILNPGKVVRGWHGSQPFERAGPEGATLLGASH